MEIRRELRPTARTAAIEMYDRLSSWFVDFHMSKIMEMRERRAS
jgi:hypothetical protein